MGEKINSVAETTVENPSLHGIEDPCEFDDMEELEPAELKLDSLDLEELETEELDLGMAGKPDPANGGMGGGEEFAELEELGEDARGPRLAETAAYSMSYNPEGGNVVADRKIDSFVPSEFLRLLGKRSIVELRLGDYLKREMTIFFSDIRQFTEIFESISPEEGFRFINSYFTRVVPIINQYGGFVDKYMGDAIMAIFPQSNGADMAVRASVEIQKQMREYNKHRASTGYRSLNVGIGIHTGPIILGVVGTHNRMQNTVISDAVNLASRIESLTKSFGVAMAISGQTFRKLEHPEKYMFRYLGNVRVRGKSEPTSVYEILNGIDETLMEKKVMTSRDFEQGLFSFALRKYYDALANFNRVLNVIPEDRASTVYSERCQKYLKRA
ncbi:MAG: hypothetical protein FWB79_02625 [Treponema sp.]|nr:hypothetical protein [Treponema sp.]